MDLLVKLAVVGLVVWLVWLAFQPRCAFVLRVAEGRARAVQGKATRALLAQVEEICAQHGVRRAVVRGVVRGRRIALAFSRDIPPSGQQQLRNWWALSGWSARPSRA